MLLRTLRLSILSLSLLVPLAAWAQSNPAPAPDAAPPAATTPSAPDASLLKPAELDGLVAPIALYPDTLLSQVLMASTYPLEVIEADRWVTQNKNLKGDQLKDAVEKQAWDDSVKSLTATPSVLSTMSTKLDWTKKLGDAVLAQQADVMDAIQRMRARAYDNKKLNDTPQQTVTVSQEGGRRSIVIQPATPDTIYVPYYEPATVFGAWPYADYPAYPYYWPYTGYIAAGVIATGIAFGAGYALGRWASGGSYWRGNVNWNSGNINIGGGNRVTAWQHNPQHRQGVRYNNANVAQKFGNNSLRAGQNQRMDFRGRNGQQVLNPGGDRGNVGDRGNLGNRGNAGDRGNLGDRGNAGNRGNVGDRANAGDRGGNRGGDRSANRGGNRSASAANRGGSRSNALGGGGSGRAAAMQSARGRASFASAGGGGFRGGGGGGGFRGGGGGGRGGGGRRSDIRLKHDIVLLGTLDQGVGFYRFAYIGSDKTYVGVMAQEIEAVRPDAVTRGPDGYLRVVYQRLGLTFQSYSRWQASGAHLPSLHTPEMAPRVARAALH